MEAVIDFVFLGSKISVDSDCTHEIKEDTCKKKKKEEEDTCSLEGKL